MLVFEGRRKPEYPGEKLLSAEKRTNNSTLMGRRV